MFRGSAVKRGKPLKRNGMLFFPKVGKRKVQGSKKEAKKQLEIENTFVGMKERIKFSNKFDIGSPPTHLYFYGSNGRRWAGLGKKNDNKNWKTNKKSRKNWG